MPVCLLFSHCSYTRSYISVIQPVEPFNISHFPHHDNEKSQTAVDSLVIQSSGSTKDILSTDLSHVSKNWPHASTHNLP